MSIKRSGEKWLADIRPQGAAGPRVRKLFDTKAEAVRFEAFTKTQAIQARDWNPKPKDKRRLSDLIARWYETHGKNLKSGERRRKKLEAAAAALGNPIAATLTAQTFADFRAKRLDGGACANTVNHDHAYLRALFNELERLGDWTLGNPLSRVRRLKVDEQELSFLTIEQIRALLNALAASRNDSARLVAMVCLATGARWSEAETLRAEQVTENRITFSETKSGKVRSVPITPELAAELRTKATGRLFGPCYDAFRNAVQKAGIALPDGQMTHVLRHTFASHFMQKGGNILTLQRILGHASLTMTMRYAHLAPEHLEEARTLNPLASL